MTTIDHHSMSAAYALDALSPDERSSFEHHLQSCRDCQDEQQGFTETVMRLGESTPMTIPDSLRNNILQAADQTVQDRPVTSLVRRARWRDQVSSVVAAAATVAAIAGGTLAWTEHQRSGQMSVQQEQISRVLASSDATATVASVSSGGDVKVLNSPSRGAVLVVGHDLESLADGRVYQLWLMHDGVAAPAGFLGDDASVTYVPGVRGADAVAMTVEPRGGSDTPSGSPIALASLDS